MSRKEAEKGAKKRENKRKKVRKLRLFERELTLSSMCYDALKTKEIT